LEKGQGTTVAHLEEAMQERRFPASGGIHAFLHCRHHRHSENVLVKAPGRFHVVRSHSVVVQAADLVAASARVAHRLKLCVFLRTCRICGGHCIC